MNEKRGTRGNAKSTQLMSIRKRKTSKKKRNRTDNRNVFGKRFKKKRISFKVDSNVRQGKTIANYWKEIENINKNLDVLCTRFRKAEIVNQNLVQIILEDVSSQQRQALLKKIKHRLF